MKKIKITERGWAGHFCAARSCQFRRNTLIEYGGKRVVVSTVGNYQPGLGFNRKDKREQEIGLNRFYETMAFRAKKEGVYWEADVSREYGFKSNWALDELEQETDQKANDMHDRVVAEISKSLTLPKKKL